MATSAESLAEEALAYARSVADVRPLPLVRDMQCKHPQGDAYFQFARNDTERKIHALTLSHTFVMVMDVFSDFLVTEQKVVSPEWQSELHAIGKLIEHRALELQAELPKDEQVKEA
mgnify:CR=1 FL=1